jgi:predicted DNA-binding protein (MmcQ/YjbR family)
MAKPSTAKTWPEAVQRFCLGFPNTEAFESHGAPSYRIVKGRVFAMLATNHHGDGRLALWLNAPPGAQREWVDQSLLGTAAERYFVPPYLGPRGWLGLTLNHGFELALLHTHIEQAYRNTAPPKLHAEIRPLQPFAAPPPPRIDEIDPTRSVSAQAQLAEIETQISALPDIICATRYGDRVWCVGKKAFAQFGLVDSTLALMLNTGAELQSMLVEQPRFSVPMYYGARGWTAYTLDAPIDWSMLKPLLEQCHAGAAPKAKSTRHSGERTKR